MILDAVLLLKMALVLGLRQTIFLMINVRLLSVIKTSDLAVKKGEK